MDAPDPTSGIFDSCKHTRSPRRGPKSQQEDDCRETDRFTPKALALAESIKLSVDLMLHEPEQTHRRLKKPISDIVSC